MSGENIEAMTGPPKAIPEHMRRISHASATGLKRSSIGVDLGELPAESRESISLQDRGRRSSIFSTEQMQQKMNKDRGNSVISLKDTPSDHIKAKIKVNYENTYIMDPSGYIDKPAIRKMIDGVLEEKFNGMKFNAFMMGLISKRVTESVLEGMKQFKLDRYKIVCSVTIIQNTGQGIRQASRFLWNDKFDNWVDGTYTNSTIIAQATVYMLYYE